MTFDYAKRDATMAAIYDLAVLGWSHLPREVKSKINVAQLFCDWAHTYGEPLSPDNLKNRCLQQRRVEKSVSFLIRNVKTREHSRLHSALCRNVGWKPTTHLRQNRLLRILSLWIVRTCKSLRLKQLIQIPASKISPMLRESPAAQSATGFASSTSRSLFSKRERGCANFSPLRSTFTPKSLIRAQTSSGSLSRLIPIFASLLLLTSCVVLAPTSSEAARSPVPSPLLPRHCSRPCLTCQLMNSIGLSPSVKAAILNTFQTPRLIPAWWMAQNHHRTHRAVALNFKRNPFQVAIYQDQSRDMRIRKSTQCGISEYGTCWALSEVDQGFRVFWVFPTDQLRNQFVHDRLDPSINASAFYGGLVKTAKSRARLGKDAPDAVTLKQIGYGALALVGSNSEVGFKSFAADSAIVDEVDQCDQANLTMTKDRLANSDRRMIRYFGNPTTTGFGIDRLYSESDRKHWTIRCVCGEWQSPDWFTHVVREESEGAWVLRNPEGDKAKLICSACDRVLDRYSAGEWVAERPDCDISGYHVSQVFSGAVSLDELWADFQDAQTNESKMQRFYNSVLGLPYEGKGAKLSEAHLNKCLGDYSQQSNGYGCFMGCDPGSVLNVVIMDGNRVVRAATVPGVGAFDQLDRFMVDYGVRLCVIDGAYDARLAQMFQDRHRGRVLRCFYPRMQYNQQADVDWREGTVKVDRTQSLDESHSAILAQRVLFPREAASIPEFYRQMLAPTRVFEKVSENDPGRFVWREGSEPDHYRHAFNYAWLARGVASRGGVGVTTL